MALVVSIEQAAANALATRLRARLLGSVTGLVDPTTQQLVDVAVAAQWPSPDKPLGDRAVTVLVAGTLEEEATDPVVVESAAVQGQPTKGLFTWRIGVGEVPLQLDIWAKFDTWRDDLIQRLRTELNRGARDTIGAYNADPFRHGVLVSLGDGWTGYADCYFDQVTRDNFPTGAQTNEWRGTYRGTASVNITLQAQSAKVATLMLKMKVHESQTAAAGQLYDISTMTTTGTTRTQGP